MKTGAEVRVGNVIRVDGKICKIVTQEMKGTGKFGKTAHLKLINLEDGNTLERSFRADDKIEDVDVHHTKMQYLYKDGEAFVFMNMETYEQFTVPGSTVGKREVFLKENTEIDVLFGEGKALSIEFAKAVELKVTSAPPPVKGGSDSNYKEVELENGLKMLVPQFIKEGESVRINVEGLSYMDRVTTKSLKKEIKKDN